MKIELDIENCKECPFFKEERMYTSDNFERVYNWFCKKKGDKKIQEYVEWYDEDKIKIPEWCPIKVKEDVAIDIDETMSIEDGLFMYRMEDVEINRTKTPKDRKVIYTGKNGYDSQHTNLPFAIGDVLTIEEIYIDRSSSTVEFSEFPNKRFNTVMFKDVNDEKI